MDKKFVIGVVVISALVLGGGMWAALRLPAVNGVAIEETGEAKAEIAIKAQEFGEVPLKGGNVMKSYAVKNVGTAPLLVANMGTSCMCTTVQLKTRDGTSPKFAMHQKSEWKGTIAPGESGEVEVVFDPAFHGPTGLGDISRMIKFETNDPNNRNVELTLVGKVI